MSATYRVKQNSQQVTLFLQVEEQFLCQIQSHVSDNAGGSADTTTTPQTGSLSWPENKTDLKTYNLSENSFATNLD